MIMHSAVFRLTFLMFIIIIPICILTLVMSSRAIIMAENQVSQDLKEALALNMNQVDNYLRNLGRRLYTVTRESADYAMLMRSTSESDEAHASEIEEVQSIDQMHAYLRLGKDFEGILSEYTWAEDVFALFPDSDMFVSGGSVQRQDSKALFEKILEASKETDHESWCVYDSDAGRLWGIFPYQNTYYGASFRLDTLLENIRLDKSSNIVTFASGNSGILSSDPLLAQADISGSESNISLDGEKYIILTVPSEQSSLILTYFVSRTYLQSSLPGYIRVLLIISIIFLVCIPILFIAFGRWLIRPVNVLIDAIDYVDSGDIDYRIDKMTGAYEFDLLNRNFNQMLDSVSELKINVYEKELEKQNIKLQYLSQQIQPHFILNAMNIIYSYEPDEYDLIQKMVLCLSKYFQFIVNANRPYVKIKHELEHISNYLTIQQIRYGDRITFSVEADEDAKDAVMPPLMIQNLVENVIKYALRDDASVNVTVTAVREDDRIRITVRDTGYGMKDEVLEMISVFKETKQRQEGLGTGIQNTIERLELFFGPEAQFEARRWNNDEGTEIVLIFPVSYGDDGTENGEENL